MLQRRGLYRPAYGIVSSADSALFTGIEAYQRSRGLTVDGTMRPGGETERRMNAEEGAEPAECAGLRHQLANALLAYNRASDEHTAALNEVMRLQSELDELRKAVAKAEAEAKKNAIERGVRDYLRSRGRGRKPGDAAETGAYGAAGGHFANFAEVQELREKIKAAQTKLAAAREKKAVAESKVQELSAEVNALRDELADRGCRR